LSRLIVRIKSRMSAGTAGLSDEQSAEQLQEVKHPKARIAHRGICASPDTIFDNHNQKRWTRERDSSSNRGGGGKGGKAISPRRGGARELS
jgi:hypothetical protein